ncbi:hypothetical protein [Synechococcus elongatus]|uniref:hypothetical protein n=1 Tax=Synechococcus elongatus TaxID=32046 RepID=UPI0030CDB9D7
MTTAISLTLTFLSMNYWGVALLSDRLAVQPAARLRLHQPCRGILSDRWKSIPRRRYRVALHCSN